ncbi:hypothetical protein [uncultured Muriicola sp.]|uniref:hypothetical protein n=1 Tax=uncultured Muriicola sp. TaxID=1583102 RepID=UPI0026330C21|nr:hypothetical protein [uncultured Muriicola sp.]
MKHHWIKGILLIWMLYLMPHSYAQESDITVIEEGVQPLFGSEVPLLLQLRYSNKAMKRETNDSTYLQSMIWFKEAHTSWDSLPVDLRARGNFRRANCYFAPLKLKFKKKYTKGSLFHGSEKIKLVLPCLIDRNSSDYVLKEYLAYKLYECVGTYHFKTRLTRIELFEERGKRKVEHNLLGFMIEDIDQVAERYDGKEIKRIIHPLQHDAAASIQNAFFEYMIANTDYSTKQQHNQKILFAEKRIIPVPFDFDMCGLVNAPYAAVTNIQNLSGSITQVTDRIYKGYEREEAQLYEVRKLFLEKKEEMLKEVTVLEDLFKDQDHYKQAHNFINTFFNILEDDKKFSKNILNRLRTR